MINRRTFIKGAGSAAALALVVPVRSFAGNEDVQPTDNGHAYSSRIKAITAEERATRLELARLLMDENKIDAVLMEGGTSMNYFTGVRWGRSERLFAMLVLKNGGTHFIAPKFEEARAQEQVGSKGILHTWEEHESPYALIRDLLTTQQLSAGVLALEESTRYFIQEGIQKGNPDLRIRSATPVTAGCRSQKSAHEIELMQVANDIAADVYKWAVPQLKEGMTETEFGRLISTRFSSYGVEGGALVLFGKASASPHGLVKENKLKAGDIVLIDGGCSVEGYESDITRSTVFGKPSDKMRQVWSIVREAQDAALKAAKPGVPAEQIDAAARSVIAAKGYGPGYAFFTHRLGHGIGLDGHEWFYLVGGNKRQLKSGNMFSNEPGIYIPGEFGIRIEDEMLITDSGARLLLPQAQSLEQLF
jgi:Xaa-Pro dipeptidase